MRPPLAPSSSAGPDVGRRQCRPAVGEPGRQRLQRRFAERHRPLLVALAEHAQHPPARVDVVDVEAAQLADADAGGVQHLDDQPVTKRQRITLLRTGFSGIHRVERLILTQHRRQRAMSLGHLQSRCGVFVDETAPACPLGEGLHGRRSSRQRRSRRSRGGLSREPRPQHRQRESIQRRVRRPFGQKGEQRPQITEIGPSGVLRPASLQVEVLVELLEDDVQRGPHSPVASLLPSAGRHTPTLAEPPRHLAPGGRVSRKRYRTVI